VLLTSRMDHQWLADAAAAGIDAAIAKTLQSAGLGALVRQVAAGNVFHAFAQLAEPGPPPAAELGLTERELEILLLVAAGDSNARIARNLWVSEQTVKFHLSNTYRKLGVRNRTEASHYAHVHRLVDLEAVRPPQAA
jgi:DNA-binding NarL/FixJ family response regulator